MGKALPDALCIASGSITCIVHCVKALNLCNTPLNAANAFHEHELTRQSVLIASCMLSLCFMLLHGVMEFDSLQRVLPAASGVHLHG